MFCAITRWILLSTSNGVIQTFYYGNNVGDGYSQIFYLNNEIKISVCVFENLFLMCLKDTAAALHFLNDPASRYFCAYGHTDADNSAAFEWVNITQVLRTTG